MNLDHAFELALEHFSAGDNDPVMKRTHFVQPIRIKDAVEKHLRHVQDISFNDAAVKHPCYLHVISISDATVKYTYVLQPIFAESCAALTHQ